MTKNFDEIFSQKVKETGVRQIVILGHMNPDGDAAGCVMGMAHYIGVNYPEYQVYPYLAETLDQGPKQYVATDLCFRPFEIPSPVEDYGVIVCDTATKARMIGLSLYEKARFSIVIDHHASNEGYGDYNDTRISEACSYNVFTILNSENIRIAAEEKHPNALDYLYLGMLHDSNCFSRADADFLRVGARLLELGVNHKEMEKTLHTMTLADYEKQAAMAALVKRTADGYAAYLIINCETKERMHIGYEDIHPFSGMLRDFSDIELGMTFYEEEPGLWRCSFRSDGEWINVNELVSSFGGGGHKAAAGLRIPTADIDGLLEKVLTRVYTLHKKI